MFFLYQLDIIKIEKDGDKMSLYDLMQNICNVDKETTIKKAIHNTTDNLKGLTQERMCKVYSGSIYDELKDFHIPARIISSTDIKEGYEHEFVLVPENIEEDKFYLIDLTFNQFPKEITNSLNQLETNGYQLIDNKLFNIYFNHVTNKNELTPTISDVFYKNSTKNNRK